jgi:hypothetical protein
MEKEEEYSTTDALIAANNFKTREDQAGPIS